MPGGRELIIKIIGLIIVGSAFSFAQKMETTDSLQSLLVADPAQNRLFWMSTGKISAPHRVSIGVFELFVFQGGYSPTDFFQMNGSATFGYYSIGTKVQILQPMGILKGVAVGADFGFSPPSDGLLISRDQLQTYTIALSLGNDEVQLHSSAMKFIQPNDYYNTSTPSCVQVGFELGPKNSDTRNTKFMSEFWFVNDSYESALKLGAIVFGMRSYGRTFVWEVALTVGPSLSPEGESSRLAFYPLPYFSLMWFI